ncbi:MAG: caspase family protein [Comamonas sp.]|uniref:caspase family protein n=1 Tax=Comamonas sp. TaxID=34028 RepID=UPI002FC8902A
MKRRALLKVGGAASVSLQSFLLQAAQAPRRHALLIGVSALLNQPRRFWLKGPVNDVALVRQSLQAHGFKPADIKTMADNAMAQPAALPDAHMPLRASILKALADLRQRIRPGDAVMLYWSGHAVRAQGPKKAVAEVDGRSTFLLASDAVRQSGADGWPLRGAVADAELGAAIDDFLALGAHVFTVMDVCHASSATRSVAEDVQWRGLRVSELEELEESRKPASNFSGDALPAVLPSARPRPVGFVGLYACEDMERTPEWTLNGQPQGVFTYALVQALMSAAAVERYASLAQRTLDLHAQLARSGPVAQSQWPSPVFEGSLQAPLWTRASLPGWSKAPLLPANHRQSWSLPSGLQLLLTVQERGKPARRMDLAKLAAGRQFLGPLALGTRFDLQLINSAAQALYVRIFYESSHGRWQALYPERAADAALLPQGLPGRPASWQKTLQINQPEKLPESLIWVVAPADSMRWIDDASAALPSQLWQMALGWQSVK